MRLNSQQRRSRTLLVALLLAPCAPLAAETVPLPVPRPTAIASAATPTTAAYRRKLAEYTAAHEAYEAAAEAYWNAITAKRRERFRKRRQHEKIAVDDYVLTQPPVYSGPPRPIDPSAPPEEKEPRPQKYIPVIADFLSSAQKYFNFVPDRPQSEIEFKRAYARVAAAAGLTREQVVRIYVFEAGGNGTYDLQAGFEYARKGARAISPALGYNQLLSTNSIGLLAGKGEKFLRALRAMAAQSNGALRRRREYKMAVLERMVAFSRSVPYRWSEHEKLADTVKGYGVHALLLDIDIGPLLQTQKLLDSVEFARRKGYHAPLAAAELEMMNLTGDGNGFDIVTMPDAMREHVPTSNFFQRRGYERNPVVRRNNTVAKLMTASNAVMERGLRLPGARQLADAF